MFGLLVLILLMVAIPTTRGQKEACIVWKDLEGAYKEKLKSAQEEIAPNMTEVPRTSDELNVDKEKIKRLPKPDHEPLNITVQFYIDDLNSISDVNMDFRVDFYYLQNWTVYAEDCIIYKASLLGRNLSLDDINSTNKMQITREYFTLFWMPDIMVSNAKEVKQQSDSVDTSLLQIGLLGDNKEICSMEYLARMYAIVSCPMDFHDAPVDTQVCSIQLRSFAFNDHKVSLHWLNEVKSIDYNNELKLLEHSFYTETRRNKSRVFDETYSVLKVLLIFDRKIANKMVGVYTPSILIVMITFCTFWLGMNSTSERVTIGITALLALVTQFNDVRQTLPPTSYVTEIDKWMIMCMVFVSAQMVQCTLVDFVYHHQKHNQRMRDRALNVIKKFKGLSQKQTLLVPDVNHKQPDKLNAYNSYAKILANYKNKINDNRFQAKPPQKKSSECECFAWLWNVISGLISVPTTPDKPEYLPMKIDAVSRIIFPLFFAAICMFYWPTMLLKAF